MAEWSKSPCFKFKQWQLLRPRVWILLRTMISNAQSFLIWWHQIVLFYTLLQVTYNSKLLTYLLTYTCQPILQYMLDQVSSLPKHQEIYPRSRVRNLTLCQWCNNWQFELTFFTEIHCWIHLNQLEVSVKIKQNKQAPFT